MDTWQERDSWIYEFKDIEIRLVNGQSKAYLGTK